jgi:hypothetical protein
MSVVLYYLLTFAESVTSVFGIRAPYEQPHYTVVQQLAPDVEIRRYDPRLAIEATVTGADRDKAASEAFGLLFRYITGANRGGAKIAMTTPVRTDAASERIEMTVPVQTAAADGRVAMRFFLPASVAAAGAPEPTDSRLRLVQVPADTIAALRFSGAINGPTRQEKRGALLDTLGKSDWKPDGDPFDLSYDPPFAIPFLRRNEVAVAVTR